MSHNCEYITHNKQYKQLPHNIANIMAIEPFVVEGAPSTQAPKCRLWVERLELYFDPLQIADARK